jgi:RNA recognition motif-containing protein
MDKFTGRSRGFAFVEMASDAEAQSAISMFHGKDFEGRTLTVNEARPMEPRGNRPPGGGYGGGGRGSYGGGGRGDRGGGHHGGRGDRGGRFDDRGGRDW